jgi:hypothetical protein
MNTEEDDHLSSHILIKNSIQKELYIGTTVKFVVPDHLVDMYNAKDTPKMNVGCVLTNKSDRFVFLCNKNNKQ